MRNLIEKVPAAALSLALVAGAAACTEGDPSQPSGNRHSPGAVATAGPSPNVHPPKGFADPLASAIYASTNQAIAETAICLLGDTPDHIPDFEVHDVEGFTIEEWYGSNTFFTEEYEEAPVNVTAEVMTGASRPGKYDDSMWFYLSSRTAAGAVGIGVHIHPFAGETFKDSHDYDDVKHAASRAGNLAVISYIDPFSADGQGKTMRFHRSVDASGKEIIVQGAEISYTDIHTLNNPAIATRSDLEEWRNVVFAALDEMVQLDGGGACNPRTNPTTPVIPPHEAA